MFDKTLNFIQLVNCLIGFDFSVVYAIKIELKIGLMKPKEEAMNHSDGGDVDDLSDDPSSPESASFDDGGPAFRSR